MGSGGQTQLYTRRWLPGFRKGFSPGAQAGCVFGSLWGVRQEGQAGSGVPGPAGPASPFRNSLCAGIWALGREQCQHPAGVGRGEESGDWAQGAWEPWLGRAPTSHLLIGPGHVSPMGASNMSQN